MDEQFNQLQVKVVDDNRIDLYLKLPIFKYPKKLYELTRNDETLRTVPKNFENLIHTLSCGSGLGISVEVCKRFKWKFLESKYNNEVLRTTYQHFMEKSITSPFASDRIEPQRIIALKDFYVPVWAHENVKQVEMFQEGK